MAANTFAGFAEVAASTTACAAFSSTTLSNQTSSTPRSGRKTGRGPHWPMVSGASWVCVAETMMKSGGFAIFFATRARIFTMSSLKSPTASMLRMAMLTSPFVITTARANVSS